LENEPSKPQVYAHSIALLCLFFVAVFSFSASAQRDNYAFTSVSKKAISAYNKAEKAYIERNTALAENHLHDALKADQNFIEAWLLLGDLCKEVGKTTEAIASFKKAISIDPTFFPPAYGILGGLLYDEGRYDEAVASFSSALGAENIRPELQSQLKKKLERAEFAADAVKNPHQITLNNLGSNINTADDEFVNSIRLDGQLLLFTRKFQSDPNADNTVFEEGFFISTKTEEIWTNAQPYELAWKSIGNMGALAFSPEGNSLYFAGCGWSSGLGSCDIYISILISDEWTLPKNLGKNLNSSAWDSQPSISADGKELYFVSNRSGGIGGSDLYKSVLLEDGSWSKPINLGEPLNTSGNEMAPYIHPDGKTLYFSSDGHPGLGGSDIFMSRKDEADRWAKPINLGVPINSISNEINLIVDASGNQAYLSAKGDGGFGGYDIYTFTLPESLKPEPVSFVKAIVLDAETSLPLVSAYELKLLQTGETTISGTTSKMDGSMIAALIRGNNYGLTISKEGYLFHSESFIMDSSSSEKPFLIEVRLQSIKKNSKIVLNNVYFDLNKAVLKPESNNELMVLAQFLKDNSNIRVELGGHTDSTGSEKFNLQLSKERAESVMLFLVKQGIEISRIETKGYGSSKSISSNETEEGRRLNRRTELQIL
jgi:outer membrane protein OmpA-like peptidoglycan-associated protein/tetratricopeptide (TPR) repeat protein